MNLFEREQALASLSTKHETTRQPKKNGSRLGDYWSLSRVSQISSENFRFFVKALNRLRSERVCRTSIA